MQLKIICAGQHNEGLWSAVKNPNFLLVASCRVFLRDTDPHLQFMRFYFVDIAILLVSLYIFFYAPCISLYPSRLNFALLQNYALHL